MNGREKKRNVSTLVYLEATSGRRRRRLRATHTGVTRTFACVRGAAATRTRNNVRFIRTFDEGAHCYHTLVWRRSRARARERERGEIEPRIEWGKRRVCGATRIHVYTRTRTRDTHTRATAPGPRGQSSHLPDKM